jgi:hypothetical protein
VRALEQQLICFYWFSRFFYGFFSWVLQWWLCYKVYRFCFSIVWFCWYLRCITGPLCIFVIVSISLLNLLFWVV